METKMTGRNFSKRTQGMNFATEYMLYGISFGAAFGFILGELLLWELSVALSVGIGLGMGAGALIGAAKDRRFRQEPDNDRGSGSDL